jgi:hypothetical protein
LFEGEPWINDCAEAAGLRIHNEHGAFTIPERFGCGACERTIDFTEIPGSCCRFLLCVPCVLGGYFLSRTRRKKRCSHRQRKSRENEIAKVKIYAG